ncbi:MAG: DUF2231 domain-containing protein [Chthoniobacterales bacterium]
MIPFPDPLHPAVVHFPIAFLLAGAFVSVAAVFLRRWHLPLFAALLLSLGAVGAVVAAVTGENEEEKVEHAIPSAERLLEEHAEWGEMARNLGLAAAALAIVAAVLASKPFFGRAFSVLTALVAFGAAYCVAEAGHFGGDLVYRHGAGVVIQVEPGVAGEQDSNRPGARHKDDDE